MLFSVASTNNSHSKRTRLSNFFTGKREQQLDASACFWGIAVNEFGQHRKSLKDRVIVELIHS